LDANVIGSDPTEPNLDPDDSDTKWLAAATADHDPFDLFRADPVAYRLVPLIFSGGRDETYGIRLVKGYVVWKGTSNPSSISSVPAMRAPYYPVDDPNPAPGEAAKIYLGTPNADHSATDNVHNHLLGKR